MICFHIRNNNKAIADRIIPNEKFSAPGDAGNGIIDGTANGTGENATINGTGNGTINGTMNSAVNGTAISVEKSVRLLKAISDNPIITYDELSALLGIPRRTVSRDMKKLRESGKIEREGARKNGRWIVNSL